MRLPLICLLLVGIFANAEETTEPLKEFSVIERQRDIYKIQLNQYDSFLRQLKYTVDSENAKQIEAFLQSTGVK